MRKKLISLLLAGSLLLTLAGCGNLFAREYSYSEPYSVNFGGAGGDATEISNYNMLKSALLSLIGQRRESGVFRFGNYNGSVVDDLAAACLEVRTSNPLGAWAVESLTYDASRIVSYYTANIEITYKRSAEEIAGVRNILTLTELETALREALEEGRGGAVLRVYSTQADEDYIESLIERLCLDAPAAIPAEPEVEVTGYPGEGANRIFDLRLAFAYDAETLAVMARQTAEQAAAISAEASAEAESRPALALALAERLDALTAAGGGWGETAYAAFVWRSAGARGTALAYKALCDAAGIECVVVKGSMGGMGAGEHFWNVISLEGAWYHVDVSRFAEDPEHCFLMDDAGFWGEYIWDADAYPECTGSLRYRDLVPEEPGDGGSGGGGGGGGGGPETPARPGRPGQGGETEPPEETAPPAETEAPEETAPPAETEAPIETEAPEETPPAETEPPIETEPPEDADEDEDADKNSGEAAS